MARLSSKPRCILQHAFSKFRDSHLHDTCVEKEGEDYDLLGLNRNIYFRRSSSIVYIIAAQRHFFL